jgi:hypothetical protein
LPRFSHRARRDTHTHASSTHTHASSTHTHASNTHTYTSRATSVDALTQTYAQPSTRTHNHRQTHRYLEQRFDRKLRTLASCIFMLKIVCYLALVLCEIAQINASLIRPLWHCEVAVVCVLPSAPNRKECQGHAPTGPWCITCQVYVARKGLLHARYAPALAIAAVTPITEVTVIIVCGTRTAKSHKSRSRPLPPIVRTLVSRKRAHRRSRPGVSVRGSLSHKVRLPCMHRNATGRRISERECRPPAHLVGSAARGVRLSAVACGSLQLQRRTR